MDLNQQHIAPGTAQRHGSAKHGDNMMHIQAQDGSKRSGGFFRSSTGADDGSGAETGNNMALFLNKT